MTECMQCTKCGGSGQVAFKHIENGKCFRCAGSGVEPIRASAPRRAPVKAVGWWIGVDRADGHGMSGASCLDRDHALETFARIMRNIAGESCYRVIVRDEQGTIVHTEERPVWVLTARAS